MKWAVAAACVGDGGKRNGVWFRRKTNDGWATKMSLHASALWPSTPKGKEAITNQWVNPNTSVYQAML
jgi:hypothetical protein